MGLDMYLKAKKSMYPNWKDGKHDTPEMVKIREIFPEMYKSDNMNSIFIAFEAGYWRKANAIHSWFVKNVQKGTDDCGEYYVSRDQLQELLKAVKHVLMCSEKIEGTVNQGWKFTKENGKENITKEGMVLANPAVAKKVLPSTSGFFFGSTDYDEYYHQDLVYTKEIIEKALKLNDDWDFEYHSSW